MKQAFHVDMYVMIFYFFQFAKEEAKTKLNKLIFLNKNLYIALDFLLLIFIFHKHNKLHSFTRHSTVDKTQRLMGHCGYVYIHNTYVVMKIRSLASSL